MTANFGKNQDVANTLDTYLLQEKPRFAILLQGKWGSGKTWFIRSFIDCKKDKKHKYCYVSLFDIEQLKEIDSQILAYCNPILSKAEGAGRFAGGIIERCIPLIKDTHIKDLGKLLTKFCKIPKNLVLVLDDFERTLIPVELVLGYVSNMLDEVGIKVILLCDQEQIPKERKEIFLRFKEKVVGSSIAIEPDIKTVFDTQIDSIPNSEIKKVFQNNQSSLIDDFKNSKSENLRNIKRIIYEFTLCYEKMTEEMQKDTAFLAHFLHTLFIFSIEVNKGLSIDEFAANFTRIGTYYDLPQEYEDISSVPIGTLWKAPIRSKFIEKFFYKGLTDEKLLSNSYADSEYANKLSLPLILYYKFINHNLDEDDANKLYRKLKMDIQRLKYFDIKVALHAFDIMLKFSQLGIEYKSEDEIIILAKEYIKNVKFRNDIFVFDEYDFKNNFLSKNTSAFKIIYASAHHRIYELWQNQIDEYIYDASVLLPSNPDEFIERFPPEISSIYKLTVLDAKEFAKKIIKVNCSKLYQVMETIYFNFKNSTRKSPKDVEWISEFSTALELYRKSMSPLPKYILGNSLYLFKKLVVSISNQQES